MVQVAAKWDFLIALVVLALEQQTVVHSSFLPQQLLGALLATALLVAVEAARALALVGHASTAYQVSALKALERVKILLQ